MAFSRDEFVNKLQNLDETQDSIVNTSKWILKQHQDADEVAFEWKEYLLKSSISTKRKLLVIYLANDVVQQAKHRQVPNFDKSFGRILPSALETEYQEFPADLRAKVKRVVGIWRQRKVLSEDVLDDIDRRLAAAKLSESSRMDTSATTNDKVDGKWASLSSIDEKITQNEKGASTLRLRFDKSLEALDPSSVVYGENYNVIKKIGNSVKESLFKSVELRTALVKDLERLLAEERDLINKEQDSINEIDSILVDREPSRLNETPASNDIDVLPTYENSDDDDDDNSSSDGSDGELSSKKRPASTTEEHDNEESNSRSSSIENDTKRLKNEEVSSAPASPDASPSKGNAGNIASSIQDLLSRLAD